MAVRARTSGRRCRTRLSAAGASVVVAVVLLLAACGSDGGSTPDPDVSGGTVSSPAPSSPTPTSPADLARRDAVAAYVGMWKADAQAGRTADWQAPSLSRYASGEALQVLTGGLYADHANGLVSRGEPINRPEVTSVEPPDTPKTVMISDCSDSRNWVRYKADGSAFTDTPGGFHRIMAEVRIHTDGLWRVTQFGVGAAGSC
ncbi:hypothetical protein ACG83_39040 [Frankia sp. R43]|nr:hypothetical protein ACG83_39040 [Frankia sp. R43]